ncbi:MAG: FGGY family carbohydrate kinase [Oscillospiraceae bacterium]
MESTYVIGVDFGTNSVRCVVSDTKDGAILASEEAEYRRWARGLYCTPKENVYRQHPKDYLEALETCIKTAVASLPQELAAQIAAIGIDTTGSTPGPVNREGIPLAMTPEFAENPDAMFWLWKDHSALREAKLVDDVFSAPPVSYTKYQGQYSSEWYWAKILHAVCSAPEVGAEAVAWVEHCDWIAAELTGERLPERIFRSSCSAGHKALFHSEWGGLPDAARLSRLSPVLVKYAANYRLPPVPAGTAVGKISEAWACRLGLSKTVVIAAGSLDAHAGAVGVGIGENVLACAFGTSSVDMLIAKPEDVADKNLTFTCGQAENSIIPGYVGIESGQAAFGDLFAWLRGLLLWPWSNSQSCFRPRRRRP